MSYLPESAESSLFYLERPLVRLRHRDGVNRQTDSSLPFFVAGNENRFVSFVCQADPHFFLSQPVLLIGPSGSGKTTLAMHLCARMAASLSLGGDVTAVRYLTAVDFARTYAEAVNADDLPPLRESIDQPAILIVDDLHSISAKKAAQDELANRIDHRIQQGKPVILTCCRLPSETRGMLPRLASRCVIGLSVAICYPKDSSRQVILAEHASRRSVELSAEMIQLLNAGLRADIPANALDAAIKQIDLHCRMHDCEVDPAAIQSAINESCQRDLIDLPTITRTVAKIWGHRPKDLRSDSRKQSIVRARSLAMLLARRLTSYSLDRIGDYFGGRDHSTVLHAIRKTESLLQDDPDLGRMLREASEKLAA